MTNTKESTIKVVRDERGRFVRPQPTPRPFKVGDVVRISKAFDFVKYMSNHNNPKDSIGIIRKIRSKTEIVHGANVVDWNNGGWNTYWDHEIELVPNAPKQRKAKGVELAVPEEISAALQTLAKAFGYRVEKA